MIEIRKLKMQWSSLYERKSGQSFGMVINHPLDPMTNLRFAEDILLVTQSCSDARKMLSRCRDAAAKYGLVPQGKIKIMTNVVGKLPSSVLMGVDSAEVPESDEAENYLGRRVSLGKYHPTELGNRIRAAWAAFAK